MKDAQKCPFCGVPAVAGCSHLALATKQTEFVERCIERCNGASRWQILEHESDSEAFLKVYGSADFFWLETDFSKFFLAGLHWYGGMNFEWRAADQTGRGDMFALLWSKDPQRLWWELSDQIASEAEEIQEHRNETMVLCPVCGNDNAEDQCKHLAFHGDDLRTAEVIGQDEWDQINKLAPGHLPDFAADFFDEYEKHFTSLAEVTTISWEGGAPGLSGTYVYVWEKDEGKLAEEIVAFVKAQLAG